MAATVLEEILQVRRRRLEEARARVPLRELERAAQARADYSDFPAAISGKGLRVIAELKQASPSQGVLRKDYQPAAIARGYESAGAAALSVLTEEDFFKGSLDHLREVRKVSALPVLRKDFIFDAYQVHESAAAGADAVLLIVAALADNELQGLIKLAEELKLAALVEVHTEEELRRAVDAGASVIGVNNRNLKTLAVDLETSFRLRPLIPAGCIAVSESGIKTAADLRRLRRAGYDAVLIGERFMTQHDPGAALFELLDLVPEVARPRR
ncbi:MAG: indole-3-glycerol phosphate synthase TrpC [Acidobacteria bacterium]|nr:indole-3-glycerol phosphate synthase TrpC [Acidobacteriota bacterium]